MTENFPFDDWQFRFENWHNASAQSDGSHDTGHFRRVWQNCLLLLNENNKIVIDSKILLAAAYFHDLINPPKNSPDRIKASALSADAAVELLQGMNYPLDEFEFKNLHHVIAAHSFSANIPAETIEAQLFQDADRLEALGAIGLARMFCVMGQMGGSLWDQDDPLGERRELNDKQFSIDHIELKLRKVAEMMKTPAGKKIAAERMQFIDDFRKQLFLEISPN
jgi:uncharacterized protein